MREVFSVLRFLTSLLSSFDFFYHFISYAMGMVISFGFSGEGFSSGIGATSLTATSLTASSLILISDSEEVASRMEYH